MELKEIIRVLRRNAVVILAILVASVLAGVVLSLVLPPRYESESRLLFTPDGEAATPSEIAQSSTFIVQQVQTYAELVETPLVLQPVIDDLSLDMSAAELAEEIDATQSAETPILILTVQASTAEDAVEIAGATVASLEDAVEGASPGDGTVAITKAQEPLLPGSPSFPDPVLTLLTALALGFVVSLGVVVLREALNTRVRGSADLARITDRPLLGVVPHVARTGTRGSARGQTVSDRLAESFRLIRPKLLPMLEGEAAPVIVVTAPHLGDGVSTTTAGLAKAFAETGRRVVLVDANLRDPAASSEFGLDVTAGLDDYLYGRAAQPALIDIAASPGLKVIAAGKVAGDPSGPLGSDAMAVLVDNARRRSDIILIDSGPLLTTADASSLAPFATSFVVVVRSGSTRGHDLQRAVDTIVSTGAVVRGVIVNDAPRRGADATE